MVIVCWNLVSDFRTIGLIYPDRPTIQNICVVFDSEMDFMVSDFRTELFLTISCSLCGVFFIKRPPFGLLKTPPHFVSGAYNLWNIILQVSDHHLSQIIQRLHHVDSESANGFQQCQCRVKQAFLAFPQHTRWSALGSSLFTRSTENEPRRWRPWVRRRVEKARGVCV